ncbi:hypothetical protein HNY73_014220 [Argiope bruennichi]|uniref:Uncharacterized protein n=1 Tax=Argiope bruennichi TaxID=94029 RepID=A0A8T0EPP5_ARGBR|nr:hypothetical protein HNY73_014220 [Argiope bruennichi]
MSRLPGKNGTEVISLIIPHKKITWCEVEETPSSLYPTLLIHPLYVEFVAGTERTILSTDGEHSCAVFKSTSSDVFIAQCTAVVSNADELTSLSIYMTFCLTPVVFVSKVMQTDVISLVLASTYDSKVLAVGH